MHPVPQKMPKMMIGRVRRKAPVSLPTADLKMYGRG